MWPPKFTFQPQHRRASLSLERTLRRNEAISGASVLEDIEHRRVHSEDQATRAGPGDAVRGAGLPLPEDRGAAAALPAARPTMSKRWTRGPAAGVGGGKWHSRVQADALALRLWSGPRRVTSSSRNSAPGGSEAQEKFRASEARVPMLSRVSGLRRYSCSWKPSRPPGGGVQEALRAGDWPTGLRLKSKGGAGTADQEETDRKDPPSAHAPASLLQPPRALTRPHGAGRRGPACR